MIFFFPPCLARKATKRASKSREIFRGVQREKREGRGKRGEQSIVALPHFEVGVFDFPPKIGREKNLISK